MHFLVTNGQDADFAALCVLLDESLDDAVGAVVQRSHYMPLNTLDKIKDAVVVYDGDELVACAEAIACGGFRYYEEGIAEVKRVFVKKAYRGQGLSKQLMEMLEDRAKEQGYTALILETNHLLVPAVQLYKSLGYEFIDNYGPYKEMKDSVCMRKQIG